MKEEGTAPRRRCRKPSASGRTPRSPSSPCSAWSAGQAVVWYTGQFYALFFLQQTLKVDGTAANLLIAWSLLIGTRVFVLFGWLSDKIGRKPIILAGCLLAAVTYFPLFKALTQHGQSGALSGAGSAPVTVTADPANCSFQFNPVGTAKFTNSCDIAKSLLARNAVNYTTVAAPAGTRRVGPDRRHDHRGVRRRARRCRRQGQAGRVHQGRDRGACRGRLPEGRRSRRSSSSPIRSTSSVRSR